MVENPPAKRETPVLSLRWNDCLEKEMSTHSSSLAWEIPWAEKAGRLSPWGLKRVRYYLVTKQQQQFCKMT